MIARITAAIANELRGGVEDVLRQGAAVATGRQGEYIAEGQPDSIYGKLQQATARQYCRRYADNPDAYSGRAAVLAEKACRPYLDDIGYGTPPTIKPPFQGGQCPTSYLATVFVGSISIAQGGLTPRTVTGPLGGVTKTTVITNSPLPGCAIVTWTFENDGASNFVAANLCGSDISNARFELSRLDSAPDICGNPPPDITPPIPPVTPGPPRERYNPSPDIDVDITVEINPDLTVNIDFGDGGGTIDPFAEPAPPAPPPSGPPPGDVGEPGSPVDADGMADAEGEAPPGKVLVGLKINVLETPVFPNTYASGVFRGAAYIYMGTNQGLDQDYAGAMLTDGQFVFAEQPNLTMWRVRANNGYVLRVTPYYREAEST